MSIMQHAKFGNEDHKYELEQIYSFYLFCPTRLDLVFAIAVFLTFIF